MWTRLWATIQPARHLPTVPCEYEVPRPRRPHATSGPPGTPGARSQRRNDRLPTGCRSLLWNRPGSYRPGRGSLVAYLLRIVHNKTVDAVRHEESLRRSTPAADDMHEEMDDGGLTDLAWEALRRHKVRATLQLLSDVQREALELAYFGGLTMSEVAGHTPRDRQDAEPRRHDPASLPPVTGLPRGHVGDASLIFFG